MKFIPRDYQEEAINAITKSLVNNNRVTAVMACGTGKTLIALWIAEKMQAKTILIIMPSLLLISSSSNLSSQHIAIYL